MSVPWMIDSQVEFFIFDVIGYGLKIGEFQFMFKDRDIKIFKRDKTYSEAKNVGDSRLLSNKSKFYN